MFVRFLVLILLERSEDCNRRFLLETEICSVRTWAEIIVKAIIEYFSNGQQPTYCMMSHCPRQSCPLKPSCPSRWLSPFSWPWQPVQTVGQPKSTPSSCVTPKHPLLSNPRRKAVFLRVTFLFQEINAISFPPFFVTPFLLLFLPI